LADIIQSCNCIPYENLLCCSSFDGISVLQPKCQTIPSGQVVNNPCYDPDSGKSYWSYKFLTDCLQDTRAIDYILIPICISTPSQSIIVSEKIDGCGQFNSIDFELVLNDINFGVAPEGFQWLKVNRNNRFDKGVCVEYRLEMNGNFPVSKQEIDIKTSNASLAFNCNGGFLVPECNPQGTLNISKTCNYTIENNEPVLNYTLAVSNIGNASLRGVQFKDVIIIPTVFSIGNITINPSGLDVNTRKPGEITISGNIGDIDPSQVRNITYRIPITSISTPGSYIVSNTAKASATGTDATATCSTTLDVSQITATECCQITDSGNGEFQLTLASIGQSPSTDVNIVGNIFIPSGVTMKFTSSDGCIATFANSSEIVPINTNLVGPLRINVTCDNINVPSGGFIRKSIKFTVVSTSVFHQVNIQSSVESVTPSSPDKQIFLGAGNLPVEVDATVQASLGSTSPCSFDL